MAHIHRTLCFLAILTCTFYTTKAQNRVSCYDDSGRAQKCKPPFVNAAFNLPVEATNTCGLRGPSEFCMQTGITGVTQSCGICDRREPRRAHPASYLTDFHQEANLTWWQSETMLDDIQFPHTVNLTLHLGKIFDITYIRLKFYTSRPESFAIYKRTTSESDWVPYQYYSASCHSTYGLRNNDIITRDDETKALCTDEYSDISPLSGASVAFSTLEGRPSAYDFENSSVLQEWVTATDIRITLNRLNTFGDEVFGDPNVLRSYFYAISDFAVGGKCQCNGHASECVWSTGQGLEERLVCRCEHNTTGASCDQCLPFYNDRPWSRATNDEAKECHACDCSGMSSRCFFDEALYRDTGHGGHCVECRDNTAGPHCQRCRDNYYRGDATERCRACQCHPIGSESQQCDTAGVCRCKPGVTGVKCDRCEASFYDFGAVGCRPCECLVEGSADNNPECLPDTGICKCKETVEGRSCDRCKPGFFGLSLDNPLGCVSCFCYGHSSQCQSARGFVHASIHTHFNSGVDQWSGVTRGGRTLELDYDIFTESIGLFSRDNDFAYFVAPSRYLGDQSLSYDRYLSFRLRVGEVGARASSQDVVLEGSGLMVSTPVFSQGNPLPQRQDQEYVYRLNEHASYQWSPSISAFQFHKLLSNLTSLRIRASYIPQGSGYLDGVSLESALQAAGSEPVMSVESCTCPEGYVGQFCESCAPSYRRSALNGGPYSRCVPCNCNSHSDICDVDTGRCICRHNTVGDNCEECAPGYYGDALGGTESDCAVCPCPGGGECVELEGGAVVCLNCPPGYSGDRCEVCTDGYFGDPQGRYGQRAPCVPCQCNDNIDYNAILNCNSTSGECLKCIYNTYGFSCDQCLPGYYGDALTLPKGDCKPCGCDMAGSMASQRDDGIVECDQESGQCLCQAQVVGRQCDTCDTGYWNINSGIGCEECDCDTVGSTNVTCDLHTGQCTCKPGVGDRRCEVCAAGQYGFSDAGCTACLCDPEGSTHLQCDQDSGQCPCDENVEGRTCDRCMENNYNITAGCVECPACYGLVQEAVNVLRIKIHQLTTIIETIGDNPQSINDTDFRQKLSAVNTSVVQLFDDARNSLGEDGSLADQLAALRAAVTDVVTSCDRVTSDLTTATLLTDNSQLDVAETRRLINVAQARLAEAARYVREEGQRALREAREAQERFGQQSERMTLIAQEARDQVTRQEAEVDSIRATANQALNTSRRALDVAQEALQLPSDTAQQIQDINAQLSQSAEVFNQTRALADSALQQANKANRESLLIYSATLSLSLPEVDVQALQDAVNAIKTSAGSISESGDLAIAQHEMLMRDIGEQREAAEEMLESGQRQQQVADELLADADVARDMAQRAVEDAERILLDAYQTLETLREFDEKVQESKSESEEALQLIPGIEAAIEEAENRTHRARSDLADALADAEVARIIAEQAQARAEAASSEARRVRDEASVTKARAASLLEEASVLEGDVEDAAQRLDALQLRAEEDGRLATQALQKADQAAESARESSATVQQALSSLADIIRQLDNLDTIDTAQLDLLEESLSSAEQRLEASDIPGRYDRLTEAQYQQTFWVHQFTEDLTQLRKDVENVAAINATIPRVCFKDVILEPTSPQQ